MGKNFRGEPGKVEKAVLKSLELKILVLNRHVPYKQILTLSSEYSYLFRNKNKFEKSQVDKQFSKGYFKNHLLFWPSILENFPLIGPHHCNGPKSFPDENI